MHYRIIAVVDKGDVASPLRSGLPYPWLPCALRKPFPWEEVQKEVQPGDICIRQGRGDSDPTTTQAGDKGTLLSRETLDNSSRPRHPDDVELEG